MTKNIYKCRVCGKYIEEPFHCGKQAILLLDARHRVRLSKLLSGLLRHYPWEARLRIVEEGWVSIDELVEGIRKYWRNKELYQWVTREHIIAVATLDPKGRFEIREDKIRARYGHSIDVSIEYQLEYPSMRLYHGTSVDKLPSILREGLKPMKRKFVHMTTSYEDAFENAKRHGTPVVLVVDVDCLKKHYIPVYRASKTVYLAPHVPPECIRKKEKW
ncbi:RNA 2'-phosphotransferase [Desulfurococcaceae archaeon MEX13E-LK6-19]|nr:RNA 2'-phosphotransferase [Desulfurococcaceae archaeon MEX13E-LK6-19]